jgi:hypothetical protein
VYSTESRRGLCPLEEEVVARKPNGDQAGDRGDRDGARGVGGGGQSHVCGRV